MSSGMETFVTTVRSLSGAGNFHELVEFLQRHAETLMKAQPTVLSTVLETLDIQQHSLGVLAVDCRSFFFGCFRTTSGS